MFLENQNLVVYGDGFQKYYLIGLLHISYQFNSNICS